MYTLRIIEETRQNVSDPFQQEIKNFEIGCFYSVVRKGHSEKFNKLIKEKHIGTPTEGVRAIICDQKEWDFFVFEDTELKRTSYFIMTESGKTFEKI